MDRVLQKKAYAKLNLALSITGRLENGYHTLDMLMQEISLHDIVKVQKAEAVRVECGLPIEEKRNTAYKAAALFFERTDIRGGAKITIQKNIPSQAGMGGGSSDAAAVIKALDELYGTGLSVRDMEEIAVRVGADVPFFIRGGCMRARGIGEDLAPVENNCGFSYLLVKPEGGVDTGQAYAAYHNFPKTAIDMDAIIKALQSGDTEAYFRCAGNALYPAALNLCPAVGDAVDDCMALGALFSMMTGSGSCVFAVFADNEKRAAAREALAQKYPFVYEAEDINTATR